MSKLSELKRATLEDFPGAPAWFEDYLSFQNAFNEDVFGRINGDISLVNTNNALVSAQCTHGVEVLIRNPLVDKRIRPVGIYAVRTDGLPVTGQPVWRNVSGDQIGLTVNFAKSVGEDITVALTGNQTIPNNVNTVVAWNGAITVSQPGSALSYDAATSSIVPLERGLYRLTGQSVFNVSAAGTRATYLRINASQIATSEVIANVAASLTQQTVSVDILVNTLTLTSFTMSVSQSSGAGLNIFGGATLANRAQGGVARCFMQATRIRNDETPTAKVLFYVIGGG